MRGMFAVYEALRTLSPGQAAECLLDAEGRLVTTSSGGSVGLAATNVVPVQMGGTITLGGTAQTAIAANSERQGFWVQNQSAGALYFSTIGTATLDKDSLLIPAGALYECPAWAVPTGAISIIGATTGQAFAAREW